MVSPVSVLLGLPNRPYLTFTRLKNVTVTCSLRSAVCRAERVGSVFMRLFTTVGGISSEAQCRTLVCLIGLM